MTRRLVLVALVVVVLLVGLYWAGSEYISPQLSLCTGGVGPHATLDCQRGE